jgi:hypothetical protein
MTGFKTPLLLL